MDCASRGSIESQRSIASKIADNDWALGDDSPSNGLRRASSAVDSDVLQSGAPPAIDSDSASASAFDAAGTPAKSEAQEGLPTETTGEGSQPEEANAQERPKPPRRGFTHSEMKEMIEHRAFSAGLSRYSQLQRHGQGEEVPASRRVAEWRAAQQAQRLKVFLQGEASAFGVELNGPQDQEVWGSAVGKRLGPRSASEGSLLRYVRSTVAQSTRAAREDLGIDVASTSLEHMRHPSFLARLDKGAVSPFSVTSQSWGGSSWDSAETRASTSQTKKRPTRSTALAGAAQIAVQKRR